ncbi:MAG: hypothetical protein ACR2K3_07885 [Nocardioides sp.]
MRDTTQLPVWTVVVLTIVPALLTGASAVLAAWLAGARKSSQQLDQWRRREETMRMVRWASDKSTSAQSTERLLALSVLDAVDNSKPEMLQAEDQGILDAVLNAVLSEATDDVEEYHGETGTYGAEVVDDE